MALTQAAQTRAATETIVREMRDVGFVEIEEKDVGASRTVAFIVAKKA